MKNFQQRLQHLTAQYSNKLDSYGHPLVAQLRALITTDRLKITCRKSGGIIVMKTGFRHLLIGIDDEAGKSFLSDNPSTLTDDYQRPVEQWWYDRCLTRSNRRLNVCWLLTPPALSGEGSKIALRTFLLRHVFPGQHQLCSRSCPVPVAPQARRLSENSARNEDYEKLRIKISASEENSGAI